MSNYAEQERAKWWPVSAELMAQYKDGTHTEEDAYWLNWQNHEHQYHRDGDLPAIICKDGTLEWWQNDLYHRYGDRPAFIGRDGHLAWFQNNHYHRLHGPAVIFTDGRLEWRVNDVNITDEVNEWLAGEEWQGTPEQIERFQRRFT